MTKTRRNDKQPEPIGDILDRVIKDLKRTSGNGSEADPEKEQAAAGPMDDN